MKKGLYLIVSMVVMPMTVCAQTPREPDMQNVLRELDETIALRGGIVANKEARILSLKKLCEEATPAARLDITESIYKEYYGFRTDSALEYSKRFLQMASTSEYGTLEQKQRAMIEVANCYSVFGDYDSAESTLQRIEGDVLAVNKSMYYNSLVLLNVWRSDYARLQENRQMYYNLVLSYRDSVYKYETDPILRTQQHSLRLLDTNLHEAKEKLRAVMPKIQDKDEYVRYIANSLASCYKRLEMPDSARYYYAMSALADLRSGVQEHSSLRELALLLFDAGDVAKAYTYTNCCLEDAQECGAQLRMIQMAGDMPMIMGTYQTLVNNQKRDLSMGIYLLVLFVLILTAFSFYLYRITVKLHRARKDLTNANDELKQSRRELEASLKEKCLANEHLEQANNIKESFVAQYMKQCMNSLELLEYYRHSMLKLAMGGANINKMVAALRDGSMAEKKHKEYMQNFDESFLSLFPTFITEFNNLLVPEERICLEEERRMNTELRIYALIRLGITESEDIGNFIGKSVKTVYNYRAKMRNKALTGRDNFDRQVQMLC